MKYFTASMSILFGCLLLMNPTSLHAQKATAELITTIAPPALEDSIPVKDGERFVTFRNNHLFLVNLWTGVQVVDVQDVQKPQHLDFLRTGNMTHQVALEGDRLFIANETEGVFVYDISDITDGRRIATIQTPGDAYWVDVNGDYLYVAMGEGGFCVMDISNLADPRTVALEIPKTWVWSINYQDSKVYVAAKRGGILIYDNSNPETLTKLTEYNTGYQAIQMAVDGNLLYVADGPGGMLILDISNPELPKEVGRFRTKGFSRHVFKSGNYAYLSNRELGLLIINTTDPANPYLEGRYTPDSETYCSYKHDVYVFLTTDTRTEILRHNNQPVMQPLSDITIDEDSSLVLQLEASDPDGDKLTYQAQNLPPGSQFNDTTGLFTWRPTYRQSGNYPGVIFTAVEETGSQLSVSDTIDITVNHVNRLPDLPSLANVTVPEDSQIVIQVQEGSDPDSEDVGHLTYHAENMPEGATFDSTTRVFRWKPTYDQSGVYVVDFVLKDGAGGADREPVTLTVTHVDRPPVIRPIADQTINENQPLAIKLQGEEPDREDQDKIRFSMLNLPPGAAFNAETDTFRWTPSYEQSGTYPDITAIMQAGRLSDTTRFTITVNHVNRPPQLAALSDITIPEDSLLSIRISGSDPDSEDSGKLSYSARNLPEGATFDADSLVFSWKPTYEQSGTYPDITFLVQDPQGLSAEESFNLTIEHVNRQPVLADIPPLAVNENSLLEYQLSASDPDQEDQGKLTYTAEKLPEGASLDTGTGLFSWTPDYTQSGRYDITFTVSDGRLSDSKQTAITVTHVNRPPAFNEVPEQTVDENQPLTFRVSASDPDSEDTGQLVYRAENLPRGATFDSTTQTVKWTPDYTQSGIYDNLTFTVTDSAGLSDRKVVQVTVNHVNRPPTLEAVAPITTREMETVAFKLSGSDPDTEDTGKLVYSIGNLPEGAVINPKTGAFTWTPGYRQSGVYQLTARVADAAGLTAEAVIPLTVENVNRPPQVSQMETVTGREDQPLSIPLQFSDPDEEDSGKLQVTATGLPEGARLDAASGEITWTPTYEQSGTYTIEYTVTDSFGATAAGTVTVQIENVNRPPVAPQVGELNASEGQEFRTTLPAGSDPDSEDAGKLTYTLENLPQGATFDPASRTLQWTPGYDQAGSYQLQYQVTDPGQLRAAATVNLTVANVNRPPQINSTGNKTVEEGKSLTFTLQASDPDREDDGKLKYSAQNLPDGAQFDQNSGQFSWTPGPDQQGSYQVTFRVQDPDGLAASTTTGITVEDVPPADTTQTGSQ